MFPRCLATLWETHREIYGERVFSKCQEIKENVCEKLKKKIIISKIYNKYKWYWSSNYLNI